MNDIIKAAILGIVEGLTEFLPVSSTGHLIVAKDLLGFNFADDSGVFEIVIQLGAVFAVLWFYRGEIWQQVRTVTSDAAVRNFWTTIVIAAIPAIIIGLLMHDWVQVYLFTPVTVAIALILGGLAFIWIERHPREASQTNHHHEVTFWQAFLIGMAQMAAIIPGVSRSGATILGALGVGLSREAATKFSFYLAIPLLGGASAYELLTSLDNINRAQIGLLAVGTVSAFIFAFLSVGWLLRYVARNTFTPFGYYRIAAGIVILLLTFITPSSAQDATPEPAPTATSAPAQIPTNAVEIPAADGQTLRGTYFAPHGEAPAVLLVHQLYTTQSSWNFLVTPLTEAGFNVLTIDLRGYGQTRGRINWQAAREDIVKWAAWLDEQSGVQSVSMIGSSMGAVLAMDGCFSYEPCTRVVALSPALSYYGVYIEDALAGDLPVMAVYADRDRYPARDMPEIVELAGDDLTVFTYAGRTHGIDLFRLDNTLGASVISFLQGNDVSQPEPAPEATVTPVPSP
jgi:undecaprenyl-diphosphatase